MPAIENPNQLNERPRRVKKKPPYEIAAWIFGSILLLFLISAFFFFPCLSSDQRGILRFLMAITGGLFAFFFVGGVVLEGRVKDLAISAAGGAAIFVLIQFVVNPFPNINCIDDERSTIEAKMRELDRMNKDLLPQNGNISQPMNANSFAKNENTPHPLNQNSNLNNTASPKPIISPKYKPSPEPTISPKSTPSPTPIKSISPPTPKPVSSVDVEIAVTVMKNGVDVTNLTDDLKVTLITANFYRSDYGKTRVVFKDIPCNQFVEIDFLITERKYLERKRIMITCDNPIFLFNQSLEI